MKLFKMVAARWAPPGFGNSAGLALFESVLATHCAHTVPRQDLISWRALCCRSHTVAVYAVYALVALPRLALAV
jgi:hypothetical protein